MEKPILRQSSLAMAEMCAYSFCLKTVDKLTELKSWVMTKGTGCHKAREVNFTAKLQTKEDLPLSDCQDAARDSINKEAESGDFLPDEEIGDKSKKDAAGMVIDRANNLVGVDHGTLYRHIFPTAVEKKVVAELPGYDFDLQGTKDLEDENGPIDLKTSKRRWSDSKPYETSQPPSYGILYRADYGVWPKKFRYHVLCDLLPTKKEPSRTPEIQIFDFTISDAWYRGTLDRYATLAKMIQAGIFPPCSSGHWKCDPSWCGFYTQCKYAKR